MVQDTDEEEKEATLELEYDVTLYSVLVLRQEKRVVWIIQRTLFFFALVTKYWIPTRQ